jgi:adenylate kinase
MVGKIWQDGPVRDILARLRLFVIVFGLPGCGKDWFARQLALCRVSSGALLTAVSQEDSDLGRRLAQMIASGEMVGVEDLWSVLSPVDWAAYSRGVILTGTPRTMEQLPLIERIEKQGRFLNVMPVYVNTPEAICRARILDPSDTERAERTDSHEAAIERRFREFYHYTIPVVEHYQKTSRLFVELDGTDTAENNADRMLQKLVSWPIPQTSVRESRLAVSNR